MVMVQLCCSVDFHERGNLKVVYCYYINRGGTKALAQFGCLY